MTATCILLAAMSFSDVAALTRTEAAHADDVCATGVVTQVVGWRSASGVFADVADPNGRGIYFSGETLRTSTAHIDGADSFRLGDVIEVKGVATPLAFAPGIKASSIKIVGRLPLPPFAEKTLFDNRLRCNSRMVDAGNPKRFKPLHSLHTNQGVLKRIIKSMTKMKRARHVRRWYNNRVRFLIRIGIAVEKPLFFPELRLTLLGCEMIVLLGKIVDQLLLFCHDRKYSLQHCIT